MPGTIVGAGNKKMKKVDKNSCLLRVDSYFRVIDNNQNIL